MNNYLKYYLNALTKYKVHSPFVFEFMTEIFEDQRNYHFFNVIENYRRNLLANDTLIDLEKEKTTINQLTKSKEIDPKYGEILFKAVHKYKPIRLVEIGTGLGISSLYQASSNSKIALITLETDPKLAHQTKKNLKQIGSQNISVLAGNIRENLKSVITNFKTIDFLFINGFWGPTTTKTYLDYCLKFISTNTVFVFNTPYTSKETIQFWNNLKKNEAVKLSIDIYGLGFLFFRPEQKEVAHYQLIEAWKKPWAIF